MRIANAIVLLLITAFLPTTPATQRIRFTPRPSQDDDLKISREDRFFVNALYVRIDDLLSKEYNKYYEPYSTIKIREYRIRQELDQTLKKRETAQNYLKLKKGEEQELTKAINEARTPEERATLSKRLESVDQERKKAEDEADTLSASTTTLNDSLRAHRAMHFAEEKDLKAQANHVNKQKMALFYKRADFEIYKTQKTYVAFRDHLMKTASSMGLTCNVSIQSERNSVETKGATIKYQKPEQRQFGRGLTPAYTAKCLTACSEEIKPSNYYIWTERDNKPTSDPEQLYSITGASHTIRLQESPQP